MKKIVFLLLILMSACSKDEDIPKTSEVVLDNMTIPMVVIIGQSNADGNAPQNTEPEWLATNNNKIDNFLVWDKNNNYFASYQLGINTGSNNNQSLKFGFDIFFANSYLKNYNGYLLCLKHTLGNTAISEKGNTVNGRWTPNSLVIPNGERKLFDELKSKLEDINKYAQKHNIKILPIAILFHQGEADADDSERVKDYPSNLKLLVNATRELFENEKIPFINAEVIVRNNDNAYINSCFVNLEKTDLLFKCVKMKDHFTDIGDGIHYDAAAHEYMGNKMFEYYQSLK